MAADILDAAAALAARSPERRELVRLLARQGGWVSLNQAAALLGWPVPATLEQLEGAVAAQQAEYNQRAGFRVAGAPMARRALQRLLNEDQCRVLLGALNKEKTQYVMGFAKRASLADDAPIHIAEMRMPVEPGNLDSVLAVVNKLMADMPKLLGAGSEANDSRPADADD